MTETTNLTCERVIHRIRKLDRCGPYYRNEVRWLVVRNADDAALRQVLGCYERRKDAKRAIKWLPTEAR